MTGERLLRLARGVGIFRAAEWLTRGELRILGYHGLSVGDQHLFAPGVFLTAATFRTRMETLRRRGYTVVPLEGAVPSLSSRTLPRLPVVLTFDDGWHSTFHQALPILEGLGFPATVYVSSYYCERQVPVLNMLIQYLFCMTKERFVDGSGLGLPFPDRFPLSTAESRRKCAFDLVEHLERALPLADRLSVASELAGRLGFSYDAIVQSRMFHCANADEVRRAVRRGFDVQLHTHRHRVPEDEEGLRREVEDNRSVLESLAGRSLRHFCYPSGVWSEGRLPFLERLGIESATTCELGLNTGATHPLALKRFLDSEKVSEVLFEAELSGSKDLVRRVWRRWGARRRDPFQGGRQGGPARGDDRCGGVQPGEGRGRTAPGRVGAAR